MKTAERQFEQKLRRFDLLYEMVMAQALLNEEAGDDIFEKAGASFKKSYDELAKLLTSAYEDFNAVVDKAAEMFTDDRAAKKAEWTQAHINHVYRLVEVAMGNLFARFMQLMKIDQMYGRTKHRNSDGEQGIKNKEMAKNLKKCRDVLEASIKNAGTQLAKALSTNNNIDKDLYPETWDGKKINKGMFELGYWIKNYQHIVLAQAEYEGNYNIYKTA